MGDDNRRDPKTRAAIGPAELERGREAYDRREWADAHRSLSHADERESLGGKDLELLAIAAYLIGRDDGCLKALERAHHVYLETHNNVRAVRCAFWLGFRLAGQGEMARATGWFARAGRLLEREAHDCVERGYLLLPVVLQHFAARDCEAAHATAAAAAEIGESFGESDLTAYARHMQGRALIEDGKIEQGLALLDEAMVAVTSGELSPLVTGLIYCSVIEGCQQVYALSRAREWTAALAEWCESQPQLVAYTATCLVHRAQILQLNGAWSEAIEETRRALERFSLGIDPQPPAAAFYQQAEVHRLKGEFADADAAYRRASQYGREPQPGLALLRAAQGRTRAAATAIRRVLTATTDPVLRTPLLPAFIEIMLAVGDLEEARDACGELERLAARLDSDVPGTLAAHARGAVELTAGQAQSALVSLRRACEGWQRIEAPYELARVRVLIGLACRAVADEEGAALELDAARCVFAQLGAMPDIVRIDSLRQRTPTGRTHKLTARELEVLRFIASGKTNKAIAAELLLSEKTVDRHVSKIFDKLNVPSRAAATAFAYKNELI